MLAASSALRQLPRRRRPAHWRLGGSGGGSNNNSGSGGWSRHSIPSAAPGPPAASTLYPSRHFSSSDPGATGIEGAGTTDTSKKQQQQQQQQQQRPTPAGTFVWRDIPYYHPSLAAADADPKHRLDVYVAAAPFPRPPQPVLVFVHGGLWVRGDRQHPYIPGVYENVGAACARAGVVGVVISYRLAPQVQHPEQCRDVARALRWAHRHAPRFGGDPSRLFLAGASAGAHLCATLLASPHLLDEEHPQEQQLEGPGPGPPGPFPSVRGLVALSGVYSLERLMRKGGGALAAASLLPAVFGDDPALWPLASPTHLLRRGAKHPSPPLPLRRTPLLLLNAAADFHLGEDTAELLGLLEDEGGGGVQRAAHVVPGTDHLSLVREVGKGEEGVVDALIFDFVRRTLAAGAGKNEGR